MTGDSADMTPGEGLLERAEQIGHRLSFTMATMAMVLLAGWLTRTGSGHSLSARAMERLGFAPADTASLNVLRAIGSAFVTNGPLALWSALLAIAGLVGATEWREGSIRATLTFWGAHLVTIGLSWLLLMPFDLAGRSAGSLIFLARDVGPSAGYVGCLGYLLAGLRPPWRQGAGAAALVIALGMLVSSVAGVRSEPVEVSAALSHAIALAVGLSAGALTARRRRMRPPANPRQAA